MIPRRVWVNGGPKHGTQVDDVRGVKVLLHIDILLSGALVNHWYTWKWDAFGLFLDYVGPITR